MKNYGKKCWSINYKLVKRPLFMSGLMLLQPQAYFSTSCVDAFDKDGVKHKRETLRIVLY